MKFSKKIQYYHEKNRCLLPRNIDNNVMLKIQKNMCLYLYYENEKDTSGHYCLINKDKKLKELPKLKRTLRKNGKLLMTKLQKQRFIPKSMF